MSDLIDDRAGEEGDEQEEQPAAGSEEAADDDGLPEDEDEAQDTGGSEQGGSDEDSSEEDEGPDDYDLEDDFIARDEEGEEEGAAAGSDADSDVVAPSAAKLKKKRKKRKMLTLDEEDYDLLEDAGVAVARPTKQLRRFKKAGEMHGSGEAGGVDQQARLRAELFGSEDEGEDEGAAEAGRRGSREDSMEDDWEERGRPGGSRGQQQQQQQHRRSAPARDEFAEEDQFDEDEDDWLVHDGEEEDDKEARVARRRRRQRMMAGLGPGVDADALEEANEIFGDVTDLLEMYAAKKAADAAGNLEQDEYGGLEEEELEDEEAAAELRARREERRREAAVRRVAEQMDPEALARHFMLPRDEEIRQANLPERQQLRRGPAPRGWDLDACARWVWERLCGEEASGAEAEVADLLAEGVREVEGDPPAWYGETWRRDDISGSLTDLRNHRALFYGRSGKGEVLSQARHDWRQNEGAQEALRGSIRAVLAALYERHEEVPFIGQYRKEVCGELLALQNRDEPRYTRKEEEDKFWPAGSIQATHRRVRRWDILWAVEELAERWRALQRRREARAAAYERALAAAGDDWEQRVLQRCLEALQEAGSLEALEDVEAKFKLLPAAAPDEALSQLSMEEPGEEQYGGSQPASGGGRRRRPQRASAYHLCRRAGLGACARGLGLAPEQLAENVDASFKMHDLPGNPEMSPLEYAEQFTTPGGGFATAEAALRGAQIMLAAEIAAEPQIRAEARRHYRENAVLSTSPTPEGETVLNPFHPLGIAKRLRNKPLSRFEDSDQYLKIAKAESEGLVTVTLGLPDAGNALCEDLCEDYLSGGETDAARLWDDLRRAVVKEAVETHLLPALQREARSRLAADARRVATQRCADRLWRYAAQPPAVFRHAEDDTVISEARIMAVCYGAGNPDATTAVMLDPQGNLVDYLHLPQLSGMIPKRKAIQGEVYNVFADPKKGQDAARLRAFIMDHRPHAIALGASHPEVLQLQLDLQTLLGDLLSNNPQVFRELGTGGTELWPMDESLASLWENSSAASTELSSAAGIVRRAVALGRLMLDPLAVLASLAASPGREVLALSLHPQQALVPEEERMAMVEKVLSTAVAQAGVDLNAVAGSAWRQPPLSFVPGLGPRKAQALLRAVGRAGGFVETRKQVWRELGVLGNVVFRNAAPALRIRAATKASANIDFDPLDDTRVHPESYQHAVAIAQSAVGGDADVAVENALAHPKEVEILELAVYANHLKANDPTAAAAAAGDQEQEGGEEGGRGAGGRAGGHTPGLATLLDIQFEFVQPYGELRGELQQLTPDQVFWLCLGPGSQDSLVPGRRVEARVRLVQQEASRLALQDFNGLEAILGIRDVSSKAEAMLNSDPTARLHCSNWLSVGDTVTARILEVDAMAGTVYLTTTSANLNDEGRWEREYCEQADRYYRMLTPAEIKAAGETARRKAAARFTARPIVHPLYKNLGTAEAVALLQEQGKPGDAIFRPSGASTRKLWLTMLLPGPEGAQPVWNLEIREGSKPAGSLKLGSPLTLSYIPGREDKVESYEDLDEVTARFVEPVQANLHKLATHRKWTPLPWQPDPDGGGNDAAAQLRMQKQRVHINQAVYCLGAVNERDKAGAFFLGFIFRNTPQREFFMVTPDGYYFRKKEFPTVDKMLEAWKRSPTQRQQPQPQQQQQAPPLPSAGYAQQVPLPPQQQAPVQPGSSSRWDSSQYGQQQSAGGPSWSVGGGTGGSYGGPAASASFGQPAGSYGGPPMPPAAAAGGGYGPPSGGGPPYHPVMQQQPGGGPPGPPPSPYPPRQQGANGWHVGFDAGMAPPLPPPQQQQPPYQPPLPPGPPPPSNPYAAQQQYGWRR